ncbi:hypothetical protein ACFS7Z_23975 [Pontibacter toksunensis]|uniref:Uncharacterized protein n=1 Tax=Pontibacter toksunensis TaxID=1332631 RepID=A0ABW6C6C8_9BACT
MSQPLSNFYGNYLNVPRKQAIGSKVHCWLQDLQNSQAREDARVEDLPHGAWIFCDAFTMEERETHEAWARVFLNARKLKDTRQYQAQPEQRNVPWQKPWTSCGLPMNYSFAVAY